MYDKTMIIVNAHIASSWKDKILGLIGKKNIEPLYFETRWGIHTFGVRESIDVVILSEENKIVAYKQNLKPNRIFIWNPKYFCILELPKGTIKKEKVKIGKNIIVRTK